jgi:hypothetical protein
MTRRRIQARAFKRCGELLEQIKTGSKGGDTRKRNGAKVAAPQPLLTRGQAARDAGLSKDQQMRAMRVARIPDDPPSVSEVVAAADAIGFDAVMAWIVDGPDRPPRDGAELRRWARRRRIR